MVISLSVYQSRWYQAWLDWQRFWQVYQHYSRLRNLNDLRVWAQRKRLTKVRDSYQRQLIDIEILLNQYTLRSRKATIWARRFEKLLNFFLPHEGYCRKGSAAKYKYKGCY